MRKNSSNQDSEQQPLPQENLELPEVPGTKVASGSKIVQPLEKSFKRQQKRFNMYIEQAHSSLDMKDTGKMQIQIAKLNTSANRRHNLSSTIVENPNVTAKLQPAAAASISTRKKSDNGNWHLNKVKSTRNTKVSMVERTQDAVKAYTNTTAKVNIKKELGRRAQSDANSDYHHNAHLASERSNLQQQLAQVTEESNNMLKVSSMAAGNHQHSIMDKSASFSGSVFEYGGGSPMIAIQVQGKDDEDKVVIASQDYSVKLPEIGGLTKSQAAIQHKSQKHQESVLSGFKLHGPGGSLSLQPKMNNSNSAVKLHKTASKEVLSQQRHVQTMGQHYKAKAKLIGVSSKKSNLVEASLKSQQIKLGQTESIPARDSTNSQDERGVSRESCKSRQSQLEQSKSGPVVNQKFSKKRSSQAVEKQMKQVMQIYQTDNNQKNQMKHQLVFADKAAVHQASSPSAGPTLNRKKQITTNQRFQSSQRMGKNNPADQQYAAQISSYVNSQEGLPQIVSPKVAKSNNKLEMRTQHTSGMMTTSSVLKSQQPTVIMQPNIIDSNNNPQILLQSKECSTANSKEFVMQVETPIGHEQDRGKGIKSVSRRETVQRNILSPMSSVADQKSPRNAGTRNTVFREKKSTQPIIIKETSSLQSSNRAGSPAVLIKSPKDRISEQILMENSSLTMPVQTLNMSQVSPRTFKNNPYNQQVASQKQQIAKRQRTNQGEPRRHVVQVDYAADNPIKVDPSGQKSSRQRQNQDPNFALFQQQSMAKSRGRQQRELFPSQDISNDMMQEAQKAGFVYKSTRSQNRRATANQSGTMNSSVPSAVKSFSNQVENLPYHIHLKGANTKGLINGKQSRGQAGGTKNANRSKLMTPSAAAFVNGQIATERNHRGIAQNSQSYKQSVDRVSLVLPEAQSELQQIFVPSKMNNKMPSLTKKQNLVSKNQASVSLSRSGASRMNKVQTDQSSIVRDNASADLSFAVEKNSRKSRGRARQPSIQLASHDMDGHTLNIPISVKTAKNEQVYLSKNISRVKKRLDQDRSIKATEIMSQRNNQSQLVSSGQRGEQERGNDKAKQQNAMLKVTQSKGAMMGAEKTTGVTDDESQDQLDDMVLNSGTHSPVIEERESPKAEEKQRRFSTQNSPRKHTVGQGRRSIIPAASHHLKKPGAQQSDVINRLNPSVQGPARTSMPPVSHLDSIQNKDMKNEKRLKNSETCPDQLSPTPKNKDSSPSHAMERKPSGIMRKKDVDEKPLKSLSKSMSQEQSMTRLPTRKQTARDSEAENKRQEMQKKALMIQLRNFRNLIDSRRAKNPDQQPLELREFQIGLQVGQGAFAIVRRATHKETKYVIAIKTYDKKNLMEKEAQMAVHREINTLSDLWHPNIMKLHEVVDQRTQVHLIMECCSGSSVFHHIKKQPDQRLPEESCKHIFKQLIGGVAYMHNKGYAHRDLKLDNILMDFQNKSIKIIDFGFSQRVRPDEKLSIYCGTPHYMDPDIVKKSPYNPFAADVWACGVILYIIYVGKLPFFGEFEGDLFRKIQTGDDKIKSLFRRIFDVNPVTRITAQQLAEHSWIKDTKLGAEQELELLREQQQQEVEKPAAAQTIAADQQI